MLREISIAGVYFPAIFFYFIASLVIYVAIDAVLSRFDVYRWFWHKSLVRVCIVILIFSLSFIYVSLQ